MQGISHGFGGSAANNLQLSRILRIGACRSDTLLAVIGGRDNRGEGSLLRRQAVVRRILKRRVPENARRSKFSHRCIVRVVRFRAWRVKGSHNEFSMMGKTLRQGPKVPTTRKKMSTSGQVQE
jgi:hypothetical protein